MKKTSLSSLFAITLLTGTGCSSISIRDSLSLIEQENGQAINEKVLQRIQVLRIANKAKIHDYTFNYTLTNKELAYADRITIATLLTTQKNRDIIIKIAPAQGVDKLQQLNLAMERANILRQYITRFNQDVTIMFAPELSTNTINLVTGA